MRVPEAADPAHAAEVVLEGSVLLHQHDDVLDVTQGAVDAVSRDRGRAGDALVERRQGGGTARDLEETTTIEVDHGDSVRERGLRTSQWLVNVPSHGR